jgi:predicted dehydrogenase
VGTGWRSDFFLRIATALSDRVRLVGLATRSPEKGAVVEAAWSIPTVGDVETLIDRFRPDFVVCSVPWAVTPGIIESVTGHGLPVLAETPPAPDHAGLIRLWQDLPDPGLVQVAEQYPYLPIMQAYRVMIDAGLLGSVTSAQISWTQQYHAVALLRALLGDPPGPVVVNAEAYESPLTESLGRDGWPDQERTSTVRQVVAMINFAGRLGVYDFTDDQWFHPLLARRINVRGSHGEIVDHRLTRLFDPRTPLTETLARRQTGLDGDLEGFDLDTLSLGGRVWYRNPYQGKRFSDEDIAIATLLTRMAEWIREDGPPPYPLARASQDHAIALAINESAATGRRIEVTAGPWR